MSPIRQEIKSLDVTGPLQKPPVHRLALEDVRRGNDDIRDGYVCLPQHVTEETKLVGVGRALYGRVSSLVSHPRSNLGVYLALSLVEPVSCRQ